MGPVSTNSPVSSRVPTKDTNSPVSSRVPTKDTNSPGTSSPTSPVSTPSVSMHSSYSKKKSSKSGSFKETEVSYSKKSKSDKSSKELFSPVSDTPIADECIVCSNDPSKSILGSSSCEDNDKTLEAKCNKHEKWIENKFCQLSCYLSGKGYEGDDCCLDEEEED